MKNGNTWLYKASLDLHDTDEPPLPSQDHRPLYGPSLRWQQARSHSSLCSLPCPAGPRVDVMPRVNLVSPPLQAMELRPEFGPQVPSPPLWLGLLQAAPVLVTLGQFLQDRKAPSEQVNRGFFHSRKEQALLVTDIRIFSPWRWWFLSANREGNLGWPPHREMPGIEQDKSHIPDASRTHGFKVVINNVLMFPPATSVRCLQVQCVTSCERRSSGRQGNQNLSTKLLWSWSLQCQCSDIFAVENLCSSWTGASHYSKSKYSYVHEICLCPISHFPAFGEKSISQKQLPPVRVLTLVTASTDVETTSALWSDQLFCVFNTIFWFSNYHLFKLDSVVAWGTSILKLIINPIRSLHNFLGLVQSNFVLYCSHAPALVPSRSITRGVLQIFKLPIRAHVFLVLFSSS